MSTKARTRNEAPDTMDRLIDEAVVRATHQATEGPRELRAGRYRPDLAERFEAQARKPSKA